MTVVTFRPKGHKPDDPHGAGRARCLACEEEWVGVAPVGTVFLECPCCHLLQGRWMFPFAPIEGDLAFTCHCSNEHFFFRRRDGRTQILCAGCGDEVHMDSVFPS